MRVNNPQTKQIESITEEIISKYGLDIAFKIAKNINKKSKNRSLLWGETLFKLMTELNHENTI